MVNMYMEVAGFFVLFTLPPVYYLFFVLYAREILLYFKWFCMGLI
jgi:hypothetical protein